MDERYAIYLKTRHRRRRVMAGDWWINKNTPVGEDAEFWERKLYSGRKEFYKEDIVAVEYED